jgi:hypothetical protein
MQLMYATRYSCDGCGAVADIDRPEKLTGERVVPEGWATGFRLEDYHTGVVRKMITDICAACAALPIGELLAKAREGGS